MFTIDSPNGGLSIGKIKNHLKQTQGSGGVPKQIHGSVPGAAIGDQRRKRRSVGKDVWK